jgi:hypothetical protein
MEALPPRRLALRGILVLLALGPPQASDAQPERVIAGRLRPALLEAARKLTDSGCRQILADFSDSSGLRLDERLAATGQELTAYLESVFYFDGAGTQPCADRQVLAWTTPGSRAVSICWDQFASFQRGRTGDAANLLIHEALHTLGLGEGPPDSREITAQVQARCGR